MGLHLTTAQYMWILPIVGITVVMLGLLILSLILGNLHLVEGQDSPKRKAKKQKKEAEGAKEATPAPDAAKAAVPAEDDVNVAIATAIYLYMQESGDKVLLTEEEQEYNVSPWTLLYRGSQVRRAEKWQLQKSRWR